MVTFLGHFFSRKKGGKNFELFCSFLLLFVFFGFRDLPILNDTAHYYEHFRGVVCNSWRTLFSIDPYDRFEVGYQVYERLIARLFNNTYSIIICSAFLVTVSNLCFIKTYTKHIAISVFLFLTQMILLFQFSAIRQALAIGFFYLAFTQLMKNRYITYFLLVLLSFSFHSSAIILFFIPLLLKIPFNVRNVFIFIIAASFAAYFMVEIINYFGFGSSDYLEKDMNRETTALGVLLKMSLMLLLIVLSLFFLRGSNVSTINRALLWLSLLGILFSALSLRMMAMGRFSSYFAPFTIILFIRAAYQDDNREYPQMPYLFGAVAFLFLIQLLVVLLFRPEWYHLVPYSFYDFDAYHFDTNFGY